jgi:hypothetical protein
MTDTDRVLGELREFKGELKEFKRATISEMHDLKREVRQIAHWRWKITGALTLLIAVSELVNVFWNK